MQSDDELVCIQRTHLGISQKILEDIFADFSSLSKCGIDDAGYGLSELFEVTSLHNCTITDCERCRRGLHLILHTSMNEIQTRSEES